MHLIYGDRLQETQNLVSQRTHRNTGWDNRGTQSGAGKQRIYCRIDDQQQRKGFGLTGSFYILIYILQVKLRCRLHHVGEGEVENPAWFIQEAEPVWEHERDELLDMNRAPPNKAIRESKELQNHIENYNKWKIDREIRLA